MRPTLFPAILLLPSAFAAPVLELGFDAELPTTVGHVERLAGPRAPAYRGLDPANRALRFSGEPGTYLEIPDAPELRFEQGDSITIEAWVRPDDHDRGAQAYLVGKGRTYLLDPKAENQNWALRLHQQRGRLHLSFLFRSADAPEQPGEFHRWTSKAGLDADLDWHHVAFRYTFGQPDSATGFIDGKPSEGEWDLGGATTRAPVSDADPVWLGSSRGAEGSNSYRGELDQVRVHRAALDDETLAARFPTPAMPTAPAPIEAPADAVRVTVAHGGSPRHWPRQTPAADQSFDIDQLALLDLPPKYGPHASRIDRDPPLLLRLAGTVELPAGEHRLLLRTRSLGRLWIDGELVGETPYRKPRSGFDLDPREPASPPYPRARLGTFDHEFSYRSEGGRHQLVIEAMVGTESWRRLIVGQLLLARETADGWQLLGPAERTPAPFTAAALEEVRIAQEDRFDALAGERRQAILAELAPRWERRHAEAREFLDSLPAVAVPELPAGHEARNPIDHFLAAKIATRGSAGGDGESLFSRHIEPLLEENCVRCHGEKEKGELKLDSREAALRAGESGFAAIVPGDAEGSELIYRVESEDKVERMPPKGEALDPEEIALLRRWIDDGAPWSEAAAPVEVPAPLGELAFLRRLFLDTVGVFPSPDEIREWRADKRPDRRARWIERLLADPRHADHWVSYWQDVLAENPGLMKPTLNNSGPFRYFLHEALLDKRPFDQLVTQLVTFGGSEQQGGAGGFRIATQNDAPMAAKAHVLGTAFLGLEMQCARCHDSPYHSTTQEDLFSMAALLEGRPVKVPASSTVPATFFQHLGGREPLISVSLDPGVPVKPDFPFDELSPAPEEALEPGPEAFARRLTQPQNRRFAEVTVNRVWKRYFGQGFVEPAGDWEGNPPSHPELLDWLAREFVGSGYSLDHLHRLILDSTAYARAPRAHPVRGAEDRYFEAPLRRRASPEQVVDSLFAASGVPFFSEELSFDIEGTLNPKDFRNFGRPRRSWEMVTTSSDRDRLALSLPRAEAIIDLLKVLGWRANRAEPRTPGDSEPNVLQPGKLANTLPTLWFSRPSDYSELTGLALDADGPDQLVDELFLRFLTREPASDERRTFTALLAPGFDSRDRGKGPFKRATWAPRVREISWTNHLRPESDRRARENLEQDLEGPPPSDRLDPDWAARLEDAVWALVNSPELQFIP